MTIFNDRENAFESKFAHDAELQFRVLARRDKLTGLWAAQALGLEGEAAQVYARSIVAADMAEAGDEDVVRKLAADLARTPHGEPEIRAALAANAILARQQIMASE